MTSPPTQAELAAQVRRFFELELPALCDRTPSAARPRGAIAFVVDGVGQWVLPPPSTSGPSNGAPSSPVISGPGLDADLVLMFSKSAFLGLLAGSAPILGRGFVFSGDAGLLDRFRRMFSSPKRGALGGALAALGALS